MNARGRGSGSGVPGQGQRHARTEPGVAGGIRKVT